jgi:hypothetical protein
MPLSDRYQDHGDADSLAVMRYVQREQRERLRALEKGVEALREELRRETRRLDDEVRKLAHATGQPPPKKRAPSDDVVARALGIVLLLLVILAGVLGVQIALPVEVMPGVGGGGTVP